MPKVSVIVPIYNVEKILKRCIDSLINQTLKDIEIILVDDESPDNCPEICDEYAKQDGRIKVIHKKNGGLGYARNSGLEQATGEYIGFVDSDDYVKCDMYEKMYEAAKKYRAQVVYGGINYVNNNKINKVDNYTEENKVFNGIEEVRQVLMDTVSSDYSSKEDSKYGASVCKGIFLKSFIIDNKIKFYSERNYVSEDSLFDIDLLTKVDKVVIIPGAYYYYDYNPTSLTSSYRRDRFEKNKELYKFAKQKLWDAYHNEEIIKQYGRSFIASSRVSIIQETNRKDGVLNQIRGIKAICKDEMLADVLKQYPWLKLPFKKCVFAFCMKYKLAFLQYLMIKLMYRKRK